MIMGSARIRFGSNDEFEKDLIKEMERIQY
jgi:hypothetical protein